MISVSSFSSAIYIEGETNTNTDATNPEIMLTSMEEEQIACTMEYAPVCGKVQIQCFTTPCEPIYQTFGNSCSLWANKLAEYAYEGECSDTNTKKEEYIKEHLDTLIKENPVLWGNWYTTKIRFFDDSYTTVEYEDGHIAWSLNLSVKVKDNTVKVTDLDELVEAKTDPYLKRFLKKFDTKAKKIEAMEWVVDTIDNIMMVSIMMPKTNFYYVKIKEILEDKIDSL